MFYAFEAVQHISSVQRDENAIVAAKQRTSTLRACDACRRRKIRCNGEHPCEPCQWYRKAASCHYTEPRPRQTASRRSVEKISQTLQEYREILQKLFPSVHPDQLKNFSRERLVELIQKSCPSHPPSPRTPNVEKKPPPFNPDVVNLVRLQPIPEDNVDDYLEQKSKALKGITDDVNTLFLSTEKDPSYLGMTSEVAMHTIKDLQDWSPIARGASEVIGIYDASKRHAATIQERTQEVSFPSVILTPVSSGTPMPQVRPQPTYINATIANAYDNPQDQDTANQELFMDNMVVTLDWGTSPIGGPQMQLGGLDYKNWTGVPQYQHVLFGYPKEFNQVAGCVSQLEQRYGI